MQIVSQGTKNWTSYLYFFALCQWTSSQRMVVCYQNCSDLLWEKIVLKASEFFCTWHDVSSQKQHTFHFSELTFATLNITFSGICFFTRTGSPIWLWNGFSSCCELGSTPTGFCTSWVMIPAGPLTVHWNNKWLSIQEWFRADA